MTKILSIAAVFAILSTAWLMADQKVDPQSGNPTESEAAAPLAQVSPAQREGEPVRVARVETPPFVGESLAEIAGGVTIYRDPWGVPHITGPTDRSVVFGMAYAQAEDFFWQVEDNYILALGRYAEVHGGRGLNSDLLNRAFRIVETSKRDYATFDQETHDFCEAYAGGLNYFLAMHPDLKPRMITHFEPWHVLAFHRQVILELCYRYTRLTDNYLPRGNPLIWAATGSNGWVLGGQRTASGDVMMMANPHLPWFGMAQLYEAHLRSDEGLQITGGTIFGSPIISIGHNENLGWTLTTNEPDIADVWREDFYDDDHPLRYRYGNGYKTAKRWTEKILIKSGDKLTEKQFTFTATHHGPVVGKDEEGRSLTAKISGLYDTVPLTQGLRMAKAKNFHEFRDAMAMMQMPMMNVLYGDREGNIYYLYGAKAPRRDPAFDWSKPVDGSDPRTEWQGYLTLDELPQVLNPPSDFLQNCNSSPFTITDQGNPVLANYPKYLAEDAHDDKRRAKRSRQILGEMQNTSFDEFQTAVFDTKVYWATTILPQYKEKLEDLRPIDAAAAERVEPYLTFLLDWDGVIRKDSAEATLCEAWYEALYGPDYPGETLLPKFQDNPAAQLEALVTAAAKLRAMHGDWKVPYGKIHRIQRLPYIAEMLDLRFDDKGDSLPSTGGHGPMGVINTQYYTPSIYIPLLMSQKKRYGVVGATYLAAWSFGKDGVKGASLVQFGVNGDPHSPHFFDQAKLLSESRLKPILFEWEDVLAGAVVSYHPGGKITRYTPEP